jgi:putative ABC transport system substrate-binding protein
VQAAADRIGQQVRIFNASSDREIDAALATIVDKRIGGLIVQTDQFFTVRRDQLVLLTTRHAIPTIFGWREFAVAGGLMSYGNEPARRLSSAGHLRRTNSKGRKTRRSASPAGLWELGWTAGSNILIEYRYASADPAQMQTHAAELVGLPAEIVLAGGSLAVAALRRETGTIPIVFVRVADPVSQGFVASLAHPGANVTGFSSLEYELSGKWLGLLKGVAPHLVRVSLMFNPPTAPYGPGFLRSFETVAPSFAVKPIGALIHNPAEIEGTMSVLGSGADGGLIVLPDAFTDVHREQIIAACRCRC